MKTFHPVFNCISCKFLKIPPKSKCFVADGWKKRKKCKYHFRSIGRHFGHSLYWHRAHFCTDSLSIVGMQKYPDLWSVEHKFHWFLYFSRSSTGVGRSLNDVRYDYNGEEYEDDDDRPTRVNSAKINLNSSSSDYQDDKVKNVHKNVITVCHFVTNICNLPINYKRFYTLSTSWWPEYSPLASVLCPLVVQRCPFVFDTLSTIRRRLMNRQPSFERKASAIVEYTD